MIMLMMFWGAIYFAGELDSAKLGRKLLSFGLTGLIMAVVARWAYKRKQLFDEKYKSLRQYTDRAGD